MQSPSTPPRLPHSISKHINIAINPQLSAFHKTCSRSADPPVLKSNNNTVLPPSVTSTDVHICLFSLNKYSIFGLVWKPWRHRMNLDNNKLNVLKVTAHIMYWLSKSGAELKKMAVLLNSSQKTSPPLIQTNSDFPLGTRLWTGTGRLMTMFLSQTWELTQIKSNCRHHLDALAVKVIVDDCKRTEPQGLLHCSPVKSILILKAHCRVFL